MGDKSSSDTESFVVVAPSLEISNDSAKSESENVATGSSSTSERASSSCVEIQVTPTESTQEANPDENQAKVENQSNNANTVDMDVMEVVEASTSEVIAAKDDAAETIPGNTGRTEGTETICDNGNAEQKIPQTAQSDTNCEMEPVEEQNL